MTSMQQQELLEVGAKNLEWFAEHYGKLQEEHGDQFVAVDRGVLVAVAASLDDLLQKIKGKVNLQTVLMEFVPAKDRLFVV